MASLPWLHLDDAVASEALDLQRRLAARGQHRRPIPDLLVAATALVHDATVLHYDRDFDIIGEVSDLSARWIIPPGTGHGGQIERRWAVERSRTTRRGSNVDPPQEEWA